MKFIPSIFRFCATVILKNRFTALVFLSSFALLNAQNLVHNFEFNGNLNDTKATGITLATFNIASSSYGTNPNRFNWSQPASPGGGLVLETDQLTNPGSYSVGFRISFNETGPGYKKILSFLGQSSDNGFYYFNNGLVLYPFTGNQNVAYQPNTIYDFVLTRNAADKKIIVFVVEANGTVNKVYEETDSSDSSIPQALNGKREFRFFMNDNAATEHTTGGSVYGIRMWDRPLTQSQVGAALSSVTTGDATNVTVTSALLTGEVNPQGSASSFEFEYGTDTNYGQTITSVPSTSSASSAVSVQAQLNNLKAETTYHYRLKSSNPAGDAFGSDKTFTTNAVGGVPGIKLWLKGDSGVLNGSSSASDGQAVNSWVDQSGVRTNDATDAQLAPPTYKSTGTDIINFNPVVDFDGTDDGLDFGNDYIFAEAADGGMTWFTVSMPDDNLNKQDPFIFDFGLYSNSGYGLVYGNNTYGIYSAPGSGGAQDIRKSHTKGTSAALNRFTIDFGTNHALYFNGATSAVVTANITLPKLTAAEIQESSNHTTGSGPFTIGQQSKTDQASARIQDGSIAEILGYKGVLSSNDYKKIESYLAIKYGISLGDNKEAVSYVSSSGAPIWEANTTYKYDIFGIGKDDAFFLNQTQSNSMNTGSGDGTGQTGKGNIIISNPALLDDGDFLIIGNDGGALNEQLNDLPAGLSVYRLGREWKVKRTGDPGSVDLEFDFNGLITSGGTTDVNNYLLLIDGDGDGDFSTGTVQQIVPNAFGSSKLIFNGINLPDGAVFTFATGKATGPGVVGANLWLKADDGASNSGNNLTGWTDQTGINTFTLNGTPAFATDQINFNPTVNFDNAEASTALPGDYLAGDEQITFIEGFAVYLKSDATSGALIGGANPASIYGKQIFGGFSGNEAYFAEGNAFHQVNDGRLAANQPAAIVNYSIKASNTYFSINGESLTPANVPLSSISLTPWIGGTNNIGGAQPQSGWRHFRGQVAEMVLYPDEVTPTDRLKIQSYFAIKYGITLDPSLTNYVDSDGNVVWNDTNYWNDVFGIGRDDASSLNQTQSNSINTGSGDGTGKSGAGNISFFTPSSMDDGDFLMIGHDNGGLTEQATDLPAGLDFFRLGREWKVKRTNDVGTISLSFDLEGIAVSGNEASDFRLIIDTDGDGDFSNSTTVITPDFLLNDVIAFTNVTLPDGAVIAFATGQQIGPGVLGANLWLKGDAGLSPATGTLTGWIDQTGNNSFTVNGGFIGIVPLGFNFNPSVRFNGINDYLQGDNSIKFQTVYAVYKIDDSNSGTVIGIDPAVELFSGAMLTGSDLLTTSDVTGNASVFISTGQLGTEKARIAITQINPGGDLSSQYTSIDGKVFATQGITGSTFQPFNGIPIVGSTLAVGGPSYFDGELAELIMYPVEHSDSERASIQSYLAIKYGITLDPSVGSYVNSSGATIWNDATYWNDVFGIGKDDASSLNQTQSNSINTGSGPGTGQSGEANILVSNPSSLDDGDFLMTGNDGGALNEQLNDLPADLSVYRLGREWKVKRTGDPGTVDLEFDFNGLITSGGTTDVNNYLLLIDVDGDGDFTTGTIQQIIPNAFGSSKLIFNGVNLTDGAVFTFATGKAIGPGVAGANLWLKSTNPALNNQNDLSAWEDVTGTNTFTINGDPKNRVKKVNFNPVLELDGAGDYLEGNSPITFQTLYAVVKKNIDQNTDPLISVNSPFTGFMMSGVRMLTSSSESGQANSFRSTGNLGTQKVRIGTLEIIPNNSLTNQKSFIDGKSFPTAAVTGTTINPFQGIPFIGSSQEAVPRYFNGQIAELIMYPASHTDDERNKIQSYLALKYGISLDPSVGNYVNSSGTTIWDDTAFWNDVFGIGKDDGSSLNQVESNSINTGDGVGQSQPNKLNLTIRNPSSLDDGDYLLLGHNNDAVAEQNTDLPANLPLARRLSREWRVKRTGDVGTVTLAIDFFSFSLLGAAAEDFKLLVDTDGDGDFTTGSPIVVDATSYSSFLKILTFQGLNLPDNAVFTLITGFLKPGGVPGGKMWLWTESGITSSGSDINTWTDQISKNSFSASGNPQLIQNGINFNNTVDFNGTSNYFIGTDPVLFQTLYAVVKRDVADDEGTIISVSTPDNSASGNTGYMMKGQSMWTGNNLINPNSLFAGSSGSLGADKARIGVYEVVAGQPATAQKSFIDGLFFPTVQISGSGTTMETYSDIPYVGRSQRTGEESYFDGQIAELLMYEQPHTDTERIKVQTYLALKFGITLDQSVSNYLSSAGTIIWSDPTNFYWNDIFGIGRDDVSGLNQEKSNSINTGSGDGTGQTGAGNLVISNPSNLDNNEFLIIGHDNAVLSETTDRLPASLAGLRRLGRQWFAEHTGDVGTLDLSFDLNGLTVSGTEPTQFRLLIDGDGDGDLTTGQPILIEPNNLTSNIISFIGISFPANEKRSFALITEVPTPGGVANESLWLEANAGVSQTGGVITSWADQTAINFFTVVGTGPTFNSNAINFNPSVSFSNTDNPEDIPSSNITGNTAIPSVSGFAVMRSNTNTSTLLGSNLAGNDYGPAFFGYRGDDNLSAGTGTTGEIKYFANSERDNFSIVHFDIGSSPGNYTLNGFEGSLIQSGGDFLSMPLVPMIGGTINGAGTNSVGWAPFNGDVAEIIVYPTSLTSGDRIEVESYLAVKYGITLDLSAVNYVDSNSNPIWNDVTYWNDVFGIGRDDASGLLQTVSNSINTGSGDGTGQSGLGNIVILNKEKLDDGDYLMIGNDSAVLSETELGLPSAYSCYSRIVREWKVQHTGDVGTIDLSFDISGLSLSGSVLADFKLLIDTDGNSDFTDGLITEVNATGLNGSLVEFEDVTLSDQVVFTFITGPENTAPTAICQPFTVQLDASGSATITAADIDDGSTDNCGIASLSLDVTDFDCSNVGANSVTLTVTDDNGNTATCSAVVTVEDNIDPIALCKDITVQLDASGNATITAADIDNGSSDNCGNISFGLSQTSFDCDSALLSPLTVTLTVLDDNGNSSQCDAQVTIEDNINPTIATLGPINVDADAGSCTYDATQLPPPLNDDNCGVASVVASPASLVLGANTVTWTVTDDSGNTESSVQTVTVVDNEDPTIATLGVINVDADAGVCTYDASQLPPPNTNDNCGVASVVASPASLVLGANTVTWTVTDDSGNTESSVQTVTVVDNEDPTIATLGAINVDADAGVCTYDASQLPPPNTNDNCGVASVVASPASLVLGANTVTWTVTDDSGNTESSVQTVTVVDNEDPSISCPTDQNVDIGSQTEYTVPDYFSTNVVIASDNCASPVTNTTQNPVAGTTLPPGTHTISFTAEDANGNMSSCLFTLTITSTLSANTPEFSLSTLTVFPNPTNGEFTLNNPNNLDLQKAVLYDLRGRKILEKDLKNMGYKYKFNLVGLEEALYFMIITSEVGTKEFRLIVEGNN
ncbi:Por secretion system C-terminal sorting domain-containing protein [Hyunsoonleella jejuensis]|uniref:Por secretion system C-terminal sorting domain-containing protein n=1 Tax=Hyunsoonleella jejuensis TaxID=419940 RepID=A0A1H9AKY5_9FLAO|nr:HYR domain-containing protein [Hyunsoonleella jejuensis]SEP77137.1 Por secretion system C-terminal sorting domain-containing protein [Hyunsoonleella jejuensis]